MKYCANDPCEVEATVWVLPHNTPLCYTCFEAYQWGQAAPKNTTMHFITEVCEEHDQIPNPDFEGHDSQCYGEIWECKECGRRICAGYGAADDYFDLCDSCYSERGEE